MQKFCIAIFLPNSLKNQQQIDNAEILHFNFDTCKIWVQNFCRAIFPLNSLKNQQQMDNAEILHFNFDTYKIWMQKFCRASFSQIHSFAILKSFWVLNDASHEAVVCIS